MNIRKLILLIILASWVSCVNMSSKENSVNSEPNIVQNKPAEPIIDSDVYDDIDLFKLEGIRKIKKPVSYPYIKIETKGDSEKRIIYKLSSKDSVERRYILENKYWTTYYDFNADSGCIRTYEFITANKIIEQDYYGTYQKTGFHLDDASIIEKNKTTMYTFWGKTGPSINPDINNLDLIKNKVNVIITEKLNNKKGILTIVSNQFDKTKNQTFKMDTSCYDIGEHSWFWWRYLSSAKPIKCK